MTLATAVLAVFASSWRHAPHEPFDATRCRGAKLYSMDDTRFRMLDDVQERIRGASNADVDPNSAS